MPSLTSHRLLEACRAPGCPVCRLEQRAVARYLDSQFYENVNSPAWRDHLRASLGFCHEHAWLAVDQRLGDALGFSIIYHDVLNSILTRLDERRRPGATRRWPTLQQIPESLRRRVETLLTALTPRKRCPACEHREEATRSLLTVLVQELQSADLADGLRSSDGLCLPHLAQVLEHVREPATVEALLDIHRARIEHLRAELAEFIRKSDYQVIEEGFGSEGDAWRRAISMVIGPRKNG